MLKHCKLIIIVFLSGFMLTVIAFFSILYNVYQTNAQKTKQFYISQSKRQIKSRVESIIYLINKRRYRYKKIIEEKLRQRTYHIYSLSYKIYNKYKNTKTQKEIKQIILDYIDKMDMFDNGKGYFFVDDLKGNEVFGPNKKLVGKNLLKDEAYSVKQEIDTIKSRTEGYVEGYWLKNKRRENRLAFVKLFEPFDWYFGMGELLDDYDEQLKQRIIYELRDYTFGLHNHGYFFIISINDINNPNCFGCEEVDKNTPDLIGKCLSLKVPDENGFFYRKKFLKDIADKGYSFVEYSYKIPNSNQNGKKISYLKLYKPFNWIIGTGVYLNDVDFFTLNLKKTLKTNFILSITFAVVAVFLIFVFIYIIASTLMVKLKRDIEILSSFVFEYPDRNDINMDEIDNKHIKKMAADIKKSLDEKQILSKEVFEEQERYKILIENMPYCVAVVKFVDGQCQIITSNSHCKECIDNYKSNAIKHILEHNPSVINNIKAAIKNKESIISEMLTIDDKYLGYSVYNIYNEEAVVIMWDKTQRYKLLQLLQESEKKFESLAENVDVGILLLSKNGDIKYANPKAKKMTENKLNVYNLLPKDKKDYDKHVFKMKKLFEKTLSGSKSHSSEIRIIIDDKEKFFDMSFVRVNINNEAHILVSCLDITNTIKREKQLEYVSIHDPLTDLYNRRFFNEEMARMFNKRNAPFGLIVIDLDGLKIINDILGHNEGDNVLKRFAHVLKLSTRQNDIVARIGGDEFVIIAPKTSDEGIMAILERIDENLKKDNDENRAYISFSYGYAIEDVNFKTYDSLFVKADKMLYENKHKQCRKEKLKSILKSSLQDKSGSTRKELEEELINRAFKRP